MPYFFFSYATADGNKYLETFYQDLCEAVRDRSGLESEDIGFRDQPNLAIGADWSTELAEAIASARVFVAVCSPSYFNSDMCGREWQIFADLTKARRTRTADRPTNLLPITWIPTDELPDVAGRIQHSQEALGKLYKKEGLQFVSRFKRHRHDYEMFVLRLAERIVQAGGRHPPSPPPAMPDLETAQNAFRPRSTDGPPSPAPAPASRGPRHVTFVVVAAPQYEVAGIRVDTSFYGSSPFDWTPYPPHPPDPPECICVSAQRVASSKSLTSALATAERSIINLVVQAQERNEVVVLIVDVWSTRLPTYHTVLIEYDERNAPTSAILVPWSEADAELSANTAALEDDLRLAFPNNSARLDTLFKAKIPTFEQFCAVLEEVIAEAQSRIFRSGTVARRAGDDRIIERPLLTPPGRGTSQ